MSLIPWRDNHDRIQDLESNLENIQEEVESNHDEIRQLRELVYEVSPSTADLSERQKEMLGLFISENSFQTKSEIADSLGISNNHVTKLLCQLRDKDFSFEHMKVEDNGKRAYKLQEQERKKIQGR